MHNNVEATPTRASSAEKEKITGTETETETKIEAETLETSETELATITATAAETETEEKEKNEKDELQDDDIHHDTSNEENTILLPEPDKQLVENIIISDALGDDGDEQAIAIKTETSVMQEDVLAEPLGEEDNLYAANIDVKPIEGVLLKVETVTENNNADDKSGRRRTTRKSAAAAAAAIRVKSEYSPESDGEILRTRSSNKRRLKLPLTDEELLKAERKKGRPPKIKSEKDSDEDDSKEFIDVDMKQCRICLSKNTLVSIFRTDGSYTVAEKIMNFCSSIKIAQKDHLPQFICNNCVQSVNVAFNLKTLCEKTDCELRSKLKKRKIKKERPIIKKEPINCNNEGENESAVENQEQDDEYVVSHESEHSAVESDSDSDFGLKRKRIIPRKKKTKGLKKRGRLSTARNRKRGGGEKLENGGNDSTDEENLGPSKRKRTKLKSTTDEESFKKKESKDSKEYVCAYCEMKFTTQNLLREHKKTHAGDKPLTCKICNKTFKLPGSYMSHLQKHKEEDNLICSQCNKSFPNKTEYKKHMTEVHEESQAKFACEKCKRAFTTQARLDKHKEGKCPGIENRSSGKKEKKKNSELDAIAVGKDLFKCVAPMTTTYWSDSISD